MISSQREMNGDGEIRASAHASNAVVRVVATVVNYRTPELATKAVTSLLAQLRLLGSHHVYLVDNASGDDSLEHFRRAGERDGWGNSVTVVASEHNGGYGYGINLALRRAQAQAEPPDYLYVLNSDALADEGTLLRLVDFMDGDPRVGIAGSRIHGPDGATQVTAFRFPSVLGELEQAARLGLATRLLHRHRIPMPEPATSCEVDWISGTSMLIRRQVFEKIGPFDEGFFLYFEETDFCRSARQAGWKVCYVAEAPVTHLGSVSTGLADPSRRMPRYWFDSRHRYLLKHHGRAYTALCDGAFVVGSVLWQIKERLLCRDGKDRPHMIQDMLASSVRDLAGWRSRVS
jgi:N-acetylglucosaminyl-diphospho-decaprenol L-rhamnosyltransferase